MQMALTRHGDIMSNCQKQAISHRLSWQYGFQIFSSLGLQWQIYALAGGKKTSRLRFTCGCELTWQRPPSWGNPLICCIADKLSSLWPARSCRRHKSLPPAANFSNDEFIKKAYWGKCQVTKYSHVFWMSSQSHVAFQRTFSKDECGERHRGKSARHVVYN